jgi:hypothetical protein
MTRLADVALAFARECLDWEDARLTPDGCVEVPASDELFEGAIRLDPTDLNAVFAAASEWCEQEGVPMSCSGRGEEMCRSIMLECLEAKRRLAA